MLTLRPHHLICLLGFEGKGYSNSFVSNMQGISDSLRQYPQQLIQITTCYDSVCEPCPQQADNSCPHQFISRLDEGYRQLLQLDNHSLLSWQEAKELIRDKLTLLDFDQICAKCEWKPYGLCERALTALLSDKAQDRVNQN